MASHRNTELPEWVKQHKTKGRKIVEKNGHYYLYAWTSRRISGAKYPVPYGKYLGVITKDGVKFCERRILDVSKIKVYEYGMSYALIQLCPDGWKNVNKNDWDILLQATIESVSPNSYVKLFPVCHRENLHECLTSEEITARLPGQKSALYRRMREQYNVKKETIDALSSISLLCFGENQYALSVISDEQKEILSTLNLDLSLEVG